MTDGFEVDAGELRRVASDINHTVDGVRSDELLGIEGSQQDCGHEEVHRALADFSTATETALQLLLRNCASASEALGVVAASYGNRDDDALAAIEKAGG